jgi:phosphoadenosine phosphosulfate reductase
MRDALTGVLGWVTGRRRDQSPTRAAMPHLELASRVKINPLARWTLDNVWSFIRAENIPYHPLHDLGYASIGDAPLTTPVRPGEHERAGRWRGSARLECGLHGI